MHQSSLGSVIGRRSMRTSQLSRCAAQQIHTSGLCLAEGSGQSSSSTNSGAPRSKSLISAEAFHRVQGLQQRANSGANRARGTVGTNSHANRFNPTRGSLNRAGSNYTSTFPRNGGETGVQGRISFTRGGGPRGRGAGGARGARGARGTRGGRGSGPYQRGGRPRRAASSNMEVDEGGFDRFPDAPATNFGILMDEDHNEYFDSNQEIYNYAQLADFIDEYAVMEKKIERLTTQAEKLPEGSKELDELAGEIDSLRASGDAGIKEALTFIVSSENEAKPYHTPTDVSVNEFDSEVGGIPIGQTSTGNVMEENLRYLANRPTQEWRDPKHLVKRLIDGEFMKFRDPTEKRKVLKLAEELAYKADAPKGTVQVGFESPSEAAKRTIAERLVQGRYNDAEDASFQSNVLNTVARISATNASYRATGRDTLLKTIQDMVLPPKGTSTNTVRKGTQKQAN